MEERIRCFKNPPTFSSTILVDISCVVGVPDDNKTLLVGHHDN
jgi:hypothetical protein